MSIFLIPKIYGLLQVPRLLRIFIKVQFQPLYHLSHFVKKNSALELADTELSLDPEVKNMDSWSGMSVVISSYDAFPVFSFGMKIRMHSAQKREIMLLKKKSP